MFGPGNIKAILWRCSSCEIFVGSFLEVAVLRACATLGRIRTKKILPCCLIVLAQVVNLNIAPGKDASM